MSPPRHRAWWVRALLSLMAGIGSAVVVAVVIAIVDIYLTGHGLQPLNSPWLEWPAWGIHLSPADAIFLVAAALAAAIVWRRSAGSG
ncbi:MAG TPA: hypothetical protein VFZ26_17295 [Gemmatimonadales bacterium]